VSRGPFGFQPRWSPAADPLTHMVKRAQVIRETPRPQPCRACARPVEHGRWAQWTGAVDRRTGPVRWIGAVGGAMWARWIGAGGTLGSARWVGARWIGAGGGHGRWPRAVGGHRGSARWISTVGGRVRWARWVGARRVGRGGSARSMGADGRRASWISAVGGHAYVARGCAGQQSASKSMGKDWCRARSQYGQACRPGP
jgi:hypothetical protein